MMHVDLAWYFLDDHGQEQGPVRGSKLRQWIQCGSISQDFRVRLLNWDGYSSVQELWPNSEVAFLLPPDIYGPTGSSRWGGYKHNQGQIIVERHAVNLEQFVETADKADAADKAEKSAEKATPSKETQAQAAGTAKSDVGVGHNFGHFHLGFRFCPTESDDQSTWIDSEDSDLKELFGHNGVLLTAGIIVADVVGAGILAMPVALANFGLYPGIIALVLLLAANVHISIVMWRVRMFCPSCIGTTTYTAYVRGAFAKAPTWQRRAIISLTGFSQKSFMVGMMVLYLLSAGKGMGMLFYHNHVCLPTWMIYAALLLLPFAATARHMGSWQSLVWINVATLMGTVLIPLGFYAIIGTEEIKVPGSEVEMFSDLSLRHILSGLSTFTFGMTSQFMLVEIIAEMKEPMQMPTAYAKVSAPFQLVMFAVAGIGGYLYMGSKVDGMMNENLPFGGAFQVAAGCMLTHMLISYLIKGVVMCKSVHRAVDGTYAHASDNRPRSWIGWICIVSSMLVLAWFLANIVPFFGAAVDLLGASVTPISCWLIPLICYMRMSWDYPDWENSEGRKGGRRSKFIKIVEWIVIGIECILALILMVFGTRSSLLTIVEEWETFGEPFECHCEGLWQTCGCSAQHAGMAQFCPTTP